MSVAVNTFQLYYIAETTPQLRSVRRLGAVATDSASVGVRIRTAREAAGLSQVELGAKVGVKQQSVQKWESGASSLSARRLEAVARALKVPVGDLLGDIRRADRAGPGEGVRQHTRDVTWHDIECRRLTCRLFHAWRRVAGHTALKTCVRCGITRPIWFQRRYR